MAGDRNKKSRTRRVSTDWGPWVYDTNRRCYVTSRINSRGEDEFEYSGQCDPTESTTDGLEAGINQISFSPDETESEGIEVVAQGGRMLPSSSGNETASFQVSTSPGSYGTSAGLASYSQGQGGRYMSLSRTTGLEAQEYGSNPSVHPQSNYTASYGSEQGTDYGGSQLGSATPLSSVDMSQPDVLGGSNGSSWNNTNTPQYSTSYNSPRPVMKPDNFSFKDQIQTGLVANSQHKQGGHGKLSKVAPSVLDVRHTRTDYLPKIPLWKEFKISNSREFRPGYVFKVVWTEPDGKSNGRSRGKPSNLSYVSDAKYGELAYTSIRRFAIFKTRPGFSLCLPILTYGGQGTMKPGVRPGHHAIIYTTLASDIPPPLPPAPLNGEGQLPNLPIRVEATLPRHTFDPSSRINYAKVYTVEHNIKVCFVGKIHRDSIAEFQNAYVRVDAMQDDNLHPDNVGYSY